MDARITRRRLLGLGAALAAGGTALPGAALATRLFAPTLRRIDVRNAGRRYAGDRSLLATVSPGVGGRETAAVSFRLDRTARVHLEAVRNHLRKTTVVWEREARLPAGAHELSWTPDVATAPGSYLLRLTVEDSRGLRRVYGGRRPSTPDRGTAPVVRVLGVEAAFDRRSYIPGEAMSLTILADAATLSLTFLRCGQELEATARNDELSGVTLGEPVAMDWSGKRSAPATIAIQSGDWPTGLYGVRLETEDGRLGFAPFVLRPVAPGTVREAVVLPTNTWQAYNFYDRDGDGWGDTWYAGGVPPVRLDRPYRDRGVPPRYRRYDLPFLQWLRRMHRSPEFLAEDDLEAMPNGDELRRLYDLVVFPGHTEYVTEHGFDVIERFRDLGGRLVFLSANNIFWRVDKQGSVMHRRKLWRDLGRPESAVVGAQYIANDDGARQAPYTVVGAAAAPWLFGKTGLVDGSTFGEVVGGYGIEIDATTAASPVGTVVLARATDVFGPGLTAEMTYYETAAGARVFAAGALDFASSVMTWPVWKLLDNLWRHMLADLPPAVEPAPPEPPPTPPTG
ncbi:MAG TPA: N,N-dimethylformamidase beta subunit family domain-containing protein [Gaiellaceae bacterium]